MPAGMAATTLPATAPYQAVCGAPSSASSPEKVHVHRP
jgi:hypothetical protein